MKYYKGQLHFNKLELKELQEHNPTLYVLAHHVEESARIRVLTRHYEEDNHTYFIVVDANDEFRLMCPNQVFYVPDVPKENRPYYDPACTEYHCWKMKEGTGCWFRRWNDFVRDMQTADPKSLETD